MESELLFNDLAGYYMPSFFRMHINTTNKIERIENLNSADFSTLMHEYVHFIQDITTLYGLGNIYNSVQYLKYAINYVYKNDITFKVPIRLDKSTLEGSLIDFGEELETITYGDSKPYSANLFNVIEEHIKIDRHLNMKSIPIFKLQINVKNFGAHTYQFGAACIMETMACIMEEKISGIDSKLHDYPYYSAIQVCDAYYKKFSRNKLRVLALCDISLNSSNPPFTFINLLKIWKKKKFMPKDARELYDNFYNNSKFILSQETASGVTKETVELEPQFINYVQTARKSLHSYFVPKDPKKTDDFTVAMNQLNQWIDDILDSVLKWRKKHPYFIIDIAEGGTNDRKALVELYNEFGLPFCTNKNHEGCFYHRNIQTDNVRLYCFMAIKQISKIFNGKLEKCQMYDYCMKCKSDKKGDVEPDTKCFTPWQRDGYDKMCPFALIWNHWNLKGKRPDDGSIFHY